MIDGLPWYVTPVFFVTTIATIWLLFRAARPVDKKSVSYRILLFLVPFWLLLTGYLAAIGFYHSVDSIPPRVAAFGVLPAVVLIAVYFLFFRREFIEKLSLSDLTLLHVVRIPVEFVLLWLSHASQVPRIMSFEGWNYDILSGISAIFVYFFAVRGGRFNRPVLVTWNILALGLLANIVTIAVLSFRSPMQKLAFDQPNIGVEYLPFIWLPAIIVPIVLFCHLASLWKLVAGRID